MYSITKIKINFDNWVAIRATSKGGLEVFSGQDNIGPASHMYGLRPQVGEDDIVWVGGLYPCYELEFKDVSKDMSREYKELKLLIIEYSEEFENGREIARVEQYSGNPKDKFGVRVRVDNKIVFETK